MAAKFPFSCLTGQASAPKLTGPPPAGASKAAERGTTMPNSGRRVQNADDRPVQVGRNDETNARIVSVPLAGWEQQKAKRVEEAFHRIVEKEWFDKFEGNLKPVEQIHINAVREHFAMRRDKIKTPDLSRKGSNAIGREEWARNVEAIDSLSRDTNVGTFFRGLAGKQRANRMKQQAAASRRAAATNAEL
jgi:hypothetical protein